MTWKTRVTDSADKHILRQADRIRRDAQKVERKIAKATKLERARAALATKEAQFRKPRERNGAFLSWLRQGPCLVCAIKGFVQVGRTEAAHIRRSYPEPGWRPVGGAEKPSDFRAVGLCPGHHRTGPDAQHSRDSAGWYADHGIYPPAVCAELKAAQEAGADPAEAVEQIAATARRTHAEEPA